MSLGEKRERLMQIDYEHMAALVGVKDSVARNTFGKTLRDLKRNDCRNLVVEGQGTQSMITYNEPNPHKPPPRTKGTTAAINKSTECGTATKRKQSNVVIPLDEDVGESAPVVGLCNGSGPQLQQQSNTTSQSSTAATS